MHLPFQLMLFREGGAGFAAGHSLFRKQFETWELCVASGKTLLINLSEGFCHRRKTGGGRCSALHVSKICSLTAKGGGSGSQ